jgi:hypothetical protein
VGQQFVQRIPVCGECADPAQPPSICDGRAPTLQRSAEGVCFDQDNLIEMEPEERKSAHAAADDHGQRPAGGARELTESIDMPFKTPRISCTRTELECECRDLGSLSDESRPSSIVVVGSGIDMQRGGNACGHEFSPAHRNALHPVKIVGARHVGEQTEVRGGHQCDVKIAQCLHDAITIGERPPGFHLGVSINAGCDNNRVVRDEKPFGQFRARPNVRLARSQME